MKDIAFEKQAKTRKSEILMHYGISDSEEDIEMLSELLDIVKRLSLKKYLPDIIENETQEHYLRRVYKTKSKMDAIWACTVITDMRLRPAKSYIEDLVSETKS